MVYLFIIWIILVCIFAKQTKFAKPWEYYIIERLGKLHRTANGGFVFLIPFIDKVTHIINIRQNIISISSLNITCLDSYSNNPFIMNLNVTYKVTDPIKAAYEIENLEQAIRELINITILDITHEMTSNEFINTNKFMLQDTIRKNATTSSNDWGTQIDNVEIINVSQS